MSLAAYHILHSSNSASTKCKVCMSSKIGVNKDYLLISGHLRKIMSPFNLSLREFMFRWRQMTPNLPAGADFALDRGIGETASAQRQHTAPPIECFAVAFLTRLWARLWVVWQSWNMSRQPPRRPAEMRAIRIHNLPSTSLSTSRIFNVEIVNSNYTTQVRFYRQISQTAVIRPRAIERVFATALIRSMHLGNATAFDQSQNAASI